MWILALALQKLWNSPIANTGQNLRDTIRNMDYTGLSGRIVFDTAHNGDILGAQTFYCFGASNNFEVTHIERKISIHT
jgi:hypothetical protein